MPRSSKPTASAKRPAKKLEGIDKQTLARVLRLLDDSSITEAEARRRRAIAQARLAEIDVAERQGKVVAVEDAARLLDAAIGISRARLLAVPKKVAAEIALEASPSKCQELIEAAVYDALRELAAGSILTEKEKTL